MRKNYYSLNVKEVLKSLKTSEKGLTKKEAEQMMTDIEKSGIESVKKGSVSMDIIKESEKKVQINRDLKLTEKQLEAQKTQKLQETT